MVPLSSTCISVCRVKDRERNRKKSHLLLLDPNPIHIMPFIFLKRKKGGRERGSREEGRVMKGERGKEKRKQKEVEGEKRIEGGEGRLPDWALNWNKGVTIYCEHVRKSPVSIFFFACVHTHALPLPPHKHTQTSPFIVGPRTAYQCRESARAHIAQP